MHRKWLAGCKKKRSQNKRLILTTLQQWTKNGIASLNPSLRKELEPFVKEDSQKTEYKSDSETVYKRLTSLGELIYQILVRIRRANLFYSSGTSMSSSLLRRVLLHFVKKTISAKSVQNPNDPDANYRSKSDQKIKGYSVNINESNDDHAKPNLITDVTVKPATAADNSYLQDSVNYTKWSFLKHSL